MCECGCGELEPAFHFPGPDGITYTVSYYDGCVDCHLGAAVIVTKILPTDEEHYREYANAAPPMDWQEYGFNIPSERWLPVVDAEGKSASWIAGLRKNVRATVAKFWVAAPDPEQP